MRLHGLTLALALVAAQMLPAHAEKITVTQYGRLIASLPWAVALDQDMFQQAGLDIEGVTPGSGGGTSIRNMLASSMPFGEVGTPAALAAIRAGVDLVIIGAGSNHVGELAWGARPESGIKTIADLKGKTVGYTNPKSVTEMIIRYALRKAEMTDEVEVLAMGGLGASLTALSQGAIDAGPVNDPILTLEPDKYTVLFQATDYMPQFTWSVTVAARDFVEQHPDVLKKYMDAHRRSVEFIYENPDAAARIYAKVWEIDPKDAAAILPKYIAWRHWSAGEISMEGLQTMEEALRLVGDLEGEVDWKALVDQRFLDDDQKSADF